MAPAPGRSDLRSVIRHERFGAIQKHLFHGHFGIPLRHVHCLIPACHPPPGPSRCPCRGTAGGTRMTRSGAAAGVRSRARPAPRLLVPPGGPSDPRWRRSVHGTPELVMGSHHDIRVDSPPARCQAWPHERAARIQSLVVARLIGRPRLYARNPVSRAATERWTALFFA